MPVSNQGVSFDRYMLVPRVLIFVTREDQVLLLRGAAHKRLWAGLCNGIGGHIEPGEDPLSAALRELWEESGLTAQHLHLCGLATIDTGRNPGVQLFIWTGAAAPGEITPSSEGSLAWFSWEHAGRQDCVEDLPVLLPRIQSYRPGDPPFIARYSYAENGQLQITFH